MFQRILFATSVTPACDHAARVAFDLAHRYQASLHIFHVLGVPTRGYSQLIIDVKTGEKVVVDDDYLAWVREDIRSYYESLIEKVADRNEIDVTVGLPHREILRAVRNIRPDLVVMGGSTGGVDDSVYKKMVTGTTFQNVTRGAAAPVLVVTRPAASFWGGFSRIVVSIDFSDASEACFEYARQLALDLDCELLLFHALDISPMFYGAMAPQDEIGSKLQVAYRRARSRYSARLAGIRGYSIDVWEGVPYVEIVKYAREKNADLIVMAHGARPAEAGDAGGLGGTMEQVILRAGCPVITLNRSVGEKVKNDDLVKSSSDGKVKIPYTRRSGFSDSR